MSTDRNGRKIPVSYCSCGAKPRGNGGHATHRKRHKNRGDGHRPVTHDQFDRLAATEAFGGNWVRHNCVCGNGDALPRDHAPICPTRRRGDVLSVFGDRAWEEHRVVEIWVRNVAVSSFQRLAEELRALLDRTGLSLYVDGTGNLHLMRGPSHDDSGIAQRDNIVASESIPGLSGGDW